MRIEYLFVVLALFALTSLVSAQVPKGNAFFGVLRQRGFQQQRSLQPEQAGSVTGREIPAVIGIVADFSGYYGTNDFPSSSTIFHVDGREYNFLFGPRCRRRWPVRPFAHALFGAGHVNVSGQGYSASDTAFSTALGGGVDFHLFPLLAWRFQGDYLQTRFFGNQQNNGRFSTGIVLNF